MERIMQPRVTQRGCCMQVGTLLSNGGWVAILARESGKEGSRRGMDMVEIQGRGMGIIRFSLKMWK